MSISLLLLLLFSVLDEDLPGVPLRADPSLRSKIGAILKDPKLKGVKLSLAVARAEGGALLYGQAPNRRLHPASNAKLITTAAALSLLGADYTYSTDLAVDRLKEGRAGKLYLIGRGDPKLFEEQLWKLVEQARNAGLKSVSGDLILDESFFGPRHLAPGFEEKPRDDASYRAASGALGLNFNSITLKIKPGARVGSKPRISLVPGGGYVKVINQAKTTKRGKERLSVQARASQKGWRTEIKISGKIPIKHKGLKVRRRIDNPAFFTGLALKQLLKRAGISIKGKLKLGSAPKKRRRLARHISAPMARLAMDVNKYSNNFMAEQLLRTIGRIKGGKGDWVTGRRIVMEFLRDKVKLQGPFQYRNGSGLFGDTALSAQQFVQLLQYMHRLRPRLPEYPASLAVGGVDGTLRKRLKFLKPGQVRAKTGTLSGVTSLSGYIEFADGELGVFSFLFNKIKVPAWKIWKIQDGILKILSRYHPPKR